MTYHCRFIKCKIVKALVKLPIVIGSTMIAHKVELSINTVRHRSIVVTDLTGNNLGRPFFIKAIPNIPDYQ